VASKKHRLHHGERGSALAVRVIPRSSRNEIAEILNDGTIKIRLAAPPVEGRANQALVEFLSEVLEVPRTKIDIVAGANSREKLVSVLDLDAATVQERILLKLSNDKWN
jgi:uncharacterized protein (TIGR00251 family)